VNAQSSSSKQDRIVMSMKSAGKFVKTSNQKKKEYKMWKHILNTFDAGEIVETPWAKEKCIGIWESMFRFG